MKDWNDIYKEYGILQEKPSEMVIKAIDFFEKEGVRKVLDLGCGTGRHTVLLIDKGFEVYACDNSEKAIEIAMKTLSDVDFKKCDMIHLDYEDNFFDGIICNHVLQHAKIIDIVKAVNEIKRVLKKNGVLFLTVISLKHPAFNSGTEIEYNTKKDMEKLDGDTIHHFFTEEEMKEFFKQFRIIKLEEYEKQSEIDPKKRSAGWQLLARKD